MPSDEKASPDQHDLRLTSLAASLPATVPFVGPETQERALGRPFLARIGANESVFGPSPKAVEAISRAASGAWMYGDPENHYLRDAIAEHHGIPAENVMVGEGIDGLLGYLVRLTVAPGDPVVTSDGAYPTFNYHVTGYGGVLHRVPYRDDAEDLPALTARAGETAARLIYVANPDNPMGSWHNSNAVAAAIAAVPPGSLLILDEAYSDFAPEPVSPPIDVTDTRVIRMRTFSKAYGLAGIRVGYAIGDAAIISAFDRVRNHFGMSRVSQAGALAALADQDWLTHVIVETSSSRTRITEIARANGFKPLISATNFVTIDCDAGPELARALVAALAREGIFVRMPFAAPGNRCIRIGAGTTCDLDVLEERLPKAKAAARAEVDSSAEQKF